MAVEANADGYREILGVDITSSEDGASWLAFLRSLVARSLTGVHLVVPAAHAGLPGASWQRCRTH